MGRTNPIQAAATASSEPVTTARTATSSGLEHACSRPPATGEEVAALAVEAEIVVAAP
jgi:hypothetical protein